MPDYETLRLIWWALLGALLVGFAVMDGFDLGVAALLRVLGRNEVERRVLLETVEPVWEGNQVWLILGGGAIFAAWPLLYAAAFSGLYFAMLLALLSLILRPVGFGFRDKIDSALWRGLWDTALTAVGIVPAFVFGVAFANLFRGLPFTFDANLRLEYSGGFFALLTPYTMLFGVLTVVMFAMHGCVWATNKADDLIAARAKRLGLYLSMIFVALLAAAGAWTVLGLPAFRVASAIVTEGPSNPLLKQVSIDGNWLDGFFAHPGFWIAPGLAYGGALGVMFNLRRLAYRSAFVCSALAIAGSVLTAGFALFPFLLPSSTDPNASLTLWDASSSARSLRLMLLSAALFLPLIVLYTSWVYRVLRGRITIESVQHGHGHY